MSDQLLCYGARLDARSLYAALDHILKTNLTLMQGVGAERRTGTPICIWGTHGLGKTMIVQDYAREHGWKLAYCAPAQFEEMGDLHGLPVTVDPDPTVVGDEYTVFAPPDWVPKEEGPGLLLLDDINRADDRILRGLMQLLQNFEMFSWALPPKWQIVATANPEGGDYSVTPMDDAMLTRLLHLTMVFDVKAWARWASRHGVDPRGIDFVLSYPELVTGKRTTPRSLSQFFEQLAPIADLEAQIELVRILAMSALDDVTVATFLAFVRDNLEPLPSPEEILETSDQPALLARITELAGTGQARRVDRLATMCTRLYLMLIHPDYRPAPRHQSNLIAFLLHESLPNDLRMTVHKDLLSDAGDEVRQLLRDRRLARLLLAGM